MSRTLIDPVIEDPKVDASAVIQEAPVEDKPQPTELQAWAESKGFDPTLDPKFLESYRNLEQDRGRLANEVGESRQLMDRVISLEEGRQATTDEAQEVSLDPTDLLSDPVATLDKYFEQREAKSRSEYDARIAQLEAQVGTNALSAKHSDANQLVNDPEFIAYVQDDPIRSRVAALAVNEQDMGALDDLLTSYKSGRTETPADAETPADPGRAALEAARSASLESAAPSGGTTSGKIYSRAALIRMKIEDPEAYGEMSFQDDVRAAYAEGRVR